ncbi:NUDIX hydrolase [Stagnihabitans tardus]|uniref:NUDIX domain-containing protein n=1 Tax=Stagnihabitans tardus TaxID=2699202 RepID=A0AAE4YCZ5_9RHOB|nr:NUDIX hydrolase [Stagnihabitans tardus]NBZ87685.1 NUDIX domain-containing protein [Stagnihabitans tardus]
MATPETPILAAAAVVLLWPQRGAVLMGQRGAEAVFMPSKVVFPGGRVDSEDAGGLGISETCAERLARHPLPGSPSAGALAACARRELQEETGLRLREAAPLRFIFRAITPAGSPRRFDARFFLADVGDVLGDPLDFSQAEAELSHLGWIGLDQARGLDLPFITEVVLSEVGALARGLDQPGVPFFDNSGPVPTFRRL